MTEVEEAMGILTEAFHKSQPDLLLNKQLNAANGWGSSLPPGCHRFAVGVC